METSLVIQWLQLSASNARAMIGELRSRVPCGVAKNIFFKIKFRNGDNINQGYPCTCEVGRDVYVSEGCGYECMCVCVWVYDLQSEICEKRLWINSNFQVTVYHVYLKRINGFPKLYRLYCVPIKIHT